MKPQKRKGGGNKHPLKRQPCPEVDVVQVEEQFERYVRKVGVQDAFKLHSYHNLDAPNGTCSRSMARLIDLIWVLVKLSPSGEIKWKTLRAGVKHVVDLFGAELVKHVNTETHLKPGQVADSMTTLLYHVRRTIRKDEEFDKVMSALDETTVLDFQKLRDYMLGSAASSTATSKSFPSSSSRSLMARATDATVDSEGYPAPSFSFSEESDPEDELPSSSQGCLLDTEALQCSPPPVKKTDWKDLLVVAKRPATASKGVAAPTMKAVAKAKVKVMKTKGLKDKDKAPHDFEINPNSICVGGGKDQTYIQHTPQGATSRQLIVSVSKNMVQGLKCSHKEVINQLLPACKSAGAKKSHVLAARAKLLSKLRDS